LDYLVTANPELYKAYLFKERLRLVFKQENVYYAFFLLGRWIYEAKHSKILEIVRLAEKIERNKPHIKMTLKCGLSSGKLEATNNIIKSIIRRSFGFRNVDNLIAMIYLRTSPLLEIFGDCFFNAIG